MWHLSETLHNYEKRELHLHEASHISIFCPIARGMVDVPLQALIIQGWLFFVLSVILRILPNGESFVASNYKRGDLIMCVNKMCNSIL